MGEEEAGTWKGVLVLGRGQGTGEQLQPAGLSSTSSPFYHAPAAPRAAPAATLT